MSTHTHITFEPIQMCCRSCKKKYAQSYLRSIDIQGVNYIICRRCVTSFQTNGFLPNLSTNTYTPRYTCRDCKANECQRTLYQSRDRIGGVIKLTLCTACKYKREQASQNGQATAPQSLVHLTEARRGRSLSIRSVTRRIRGLFSSKKGEILEFTDHAK